MTPGTASAMETNTSGSFDNMVQNFDYNYGQIGRRGAGAGEHATYKRIIRAQFIKFGDQPASSSHSTPMPPARVADKKEAVPPSAVIPPENTDKKGTAPSPAVITGIDTDENEVAPPAKKSEKK